ncbi:MAG: glycerophosphodiester phosphodiesterase [Nitrospiraceae bacterium]
MTKERPPKKGVLRIGHRGACGHAPENTLRSIAQAIALGCDMFEVDVQRTKDGHLVLIHDPRVDRTTNGKGLVAEMDLEELRTLDAGGGQKIPTLEEALQAASGRIGLILEVKAEGLAYDLCSIVRASGFAGPILYASFLPDELQHLRRAEPEARLMLLLKRPPKDPVAEAARLQATHVGLRFDTATKPLVTTLHKARLTVFVYTVNKRKDIQRMRAVRVDGIVSDFPDRI